jgi:hypothetical protein
MSAIPRISDVTRTSGDVRDGAKSGHCIAALDYLIQKRAATIVRMISANDFCQSIPLRRYIYGLLQKWFDFQTDNFRLVMALR